VRNDSGADGDYRYLGEFVDEAEIPHGVRYSLGEPFGPRIVASYLNDWGGNSAAGEPTYPTPDEG
jgi:hypothetical protein